MLVDDMILVGRRLKSFMLKLEPKIVESLAANALRSKESLKEAISEINKINLDVVIVMIRYYNTLSISYRETLMKSLDIEIKLDNIANVELINYNALSDVDKIIFEIIYTLAIVDGNTDK